MALTTIPTQERTVDPYSSYFSNVINRLTRTVSNNTNCLFSPHAIDVTSDFTSVLDTVIVGIGQCFCQDVLIEITEEFSVDLTDPSFFLESTAMTEVGAYYLTLKYEFSKSKPPPTASIVCLKPSEKDFYSADSHYLFLKCINVIFNGVIFVIDSLTNYDSGITTNRRTFSPLFAGLENTLPVFDQNLHEGKIIYIQGTDNLYHGTSTEWSLIVDTSGTPVADDVAVFTDEDTIKGLNYTEFKSALEIVDISGTPVASDFAIFTDANTIEGKTQAELNLLIGTDIQAYDANNALTTTKLDDFATPDDNTDLNATTGVHGLLPKLGSRTTNYLRADGTWAEPAGTGTGTVDTSGTPVATDFARFSDPDTIEGRDASQVRGDIDVYSTAEAQADSIKWALVFGG